MEARCNLEVLVIISMITACFCMDPCVVYDLMWMENGRRSSDFNSKDTATSICDAYLDQKIWYRFEHDAGSRLIEKPVEPWHCGTQAPIWLNGTHPTDATEVAAEVCASLSTIDTCGWKGTVRIRLCKANGREYFVYKLTAPPVCPLAYCVDAASRKQCVPPLRWLHQKFKCGIEEIKATPRIPPPLIPTCSSRPHVPAPGPGPGPGSGPGPGPGHERDSGPGPGWSTWGPWSVCSKPCDYGLQSRKRKCERPPCEGAASNIQLCNRYNCPELPEEKDKGILLQLKSKFNESEIMGQIVENQQIINTILRNNINKICSQCMPLCCGHSIESSTVSTEYVTSSDIYTAQGYPHPKSELVGYYKIIAVINEDIAKTICGRSDSRQQRSVRQLQSSISPNFVSFEVMKLAIKESLAAIEQETGLIVKEYFDPAAVPDGSNHGDGGSCPVGTCIVPIVICLIILTTAVIVIGCFCHVMTAIKTRFQSDPCPPAYEYIVESGQCSPVTMMPFDVSAFVNTGQEKYDDPRRMSEESGELPEKLECEILPEQSQYEELPEA